MPWRTNASNTDWKDTEGYSEGYWRSTPPSSLLMERVPVAFTSTLGSSRPGTETMKPPDSDTRETEPLPSTQMLRLLPQTVEAGDC